MGRLKPGVTAARAREMSERWMPELPAIRMTLFEPNAIAVQPERTWRIARRDEARSFLGSLFAVCAIVLLAASANIVDHHLGRCVVRRRELSIRAALGAGRARIARQVAAECVLLGVATAGVATLVSIVVVRAMATLPGLYLGITERAARITTAGAIDGRLAVATLALRLRGTGRARPRGGSRWADGGGTPGRGRSSETRAKWAPIGWTWLDGWPSARGSPWPTLEGRPGRENGLRRPKVSPEPHPRISDWVVRTASEIICAQGWANLIGPCGTGPPPPPAH